MKKPKQCEWLEGVSSQDVSAWNRCHEPAEFQLTKDTVEVGCVCAYHAGVAQQALGCEFKRMNTKMTDTMI